VSFVLDYIEFNFDGLVLAALAGPVLFRDDRAFGPGAAGYRDALCGQIGKVVQSTSESTRILSVTFEDGTRLAVPLDAAEPPGPEMAMLSARGSFIASWSKPQDTDKMK